MSYVIKSNGDKQRFSIGKVRRSLVEAGASKELTREVLDKIREQEFDEIPSNELLEIILGYLKKDKKVRARYDLRRAISDLGPTGFPFENYFALVLREHGFETKTSQYLEGKNITHEVDIVAKRGKNHMIECKFHNQYKTRTRVKDPLYVYARFLDLKRYFDEPWLATNTKCTKDVIDYARGVNMRITAWDFPEEFSLQKLVDSKKIYPITVLSLVNGEKKERFFKCGYYLVRDLAESNFKKIVRRTKLSEDYLKRVINEAKVIMG